MYTFKGIQRHTCIPSKVSKDLHVYLQRYPKTYMYTFKGIQRHTCIPSKVSKDIHVYLQRYPKTYMYTFKGIQRHTCIPSKVSKDIHVYLQRYPKTYIYTLFNFRIYAVSRVLHTVFYQMGVQPHRATAHFIGYLTLLSMSVQVIISVW